MAAGAAAAAAAAADEAAKTAAMPAPTSLLMRKNKLHLVVRISVLIGVVTAMLHHLLWSVPAAMLFILGC